jgi:hypothetical protein
VRATDRVDPGAAFWNDAGTLAALRARDFGAMFRLLLDATGASQTRLGIDVDLAQGQVSEIVRDMRKVTQLDVMERIAGGLQMPDHARVALGLAPVDGATIHLPAVVTGPNVTDSALDYAPDLTTTLDTVEQLGRDDMNRRHFLRNAAFAAAAAVGPSRDWLLATLDEATGARGRVSGAQVDAIRRMFSTFQDFDVMRGGGYARQRLTGFLTDTVVPLLRSNDSGTKAGRALYEAGAEQFYLVGWMAYDDGQHPLAQRYLVQALRLSEAAGSPELGAHVLAGLSDQATLTGNPAEGLQLAKAGRQGLAKGESAACLADLWALQARAEAALGDAKAAERSVRASEQVFAEVDHAAEPAWAKFIDVAYLTGEYAHAFRDLEVADEASRYAAVSAADAARQSRARRGSLAHATLARAAIVDHDLEAAAAEGMATVRLAASVDSSRSREAVADLRDRLDGHRDSPPVAEFFDLADVLA